MSKANRSSDVSRPPTKSGLGDPHAIDSEVGRLKIELADLRHLLDHNERLATLGTIAGLIAHELNNIMTPVCSYAQMALESPGDDVLVRKALERTLAGAERATRISAAILGFVRDDSGLNVTAQESGDTSDACCADGGSNKSSSKGRSQADCGGACKGVCGGSCRGRRAAGELTGSCGCKPGLPHGANRVHFPTQSCDIDTALDDACLCVARDTARDGIVFERRIPQGLAAAIRPIALQHVLINLILNARNAMTRTGGTLTLDARVCDNPPRPASGEVCSLSCSTWNTSNDRARSDGSGDELGSDHRPLLSDALELARADLSTPRATESSKRTQSSVVIHVRDTGRGMDAERLSQIFKPFFTSGAADTASRPPREYSRSSERRTGTGLGMTVCKRLVEDAGGYLLVSSEPGRGTCVTIVLPAAAPSMRQAG